MKKEKMTKTKAKEIAKDVLQSSIGCAYYKLHNENYNDNEIELICKYLNDLCEKACKAINVKYVTY